MTPEEHGRVREVFENALSMNGPARDAFLDLECSGQAAIREEVNRLLRAHERVPAWLDRPALGMQAPALPNMNGRHLGGYTLIREIGRGGMGCVYLAERSDGTFHKQAAIKLVLPSSNSAMMIARFQQEREILASLDHPNIARLLDGGVTEEGSPYFVMEYVEGQPIHRWCDERKLNISQRIELFRGVLAAVRYAHQRLVVHRDLKPGNILVTDDGVVKLLDFGIAKVVTAERGKVPDTVTLAAMMTPEYASPEQANGAPITTLSDVYSLGVILYELLTGHRPYRLLSAAMHEMARVIAEVEPARPSEVVTTTEAGSGNGRGPITPVAVSAVREGNPQRLRKRLAGDLDSILLMPLHKEPDRRYGSVEAMAGALEGHLDRRPVAARQATPWYRVRRFFRRNPGALVAGILMWIALSAGLIAVVLQTRRDLAPQPTQTADGVSFIVFAIGVALVALGFAVYLARPGRHKLLGALVGGTIWAGAQFASAWTSHAMRWWHGRVAGTPEPLLLFGDPIWLSPYPWIAAALAQTAVLFLLSWMHRRWGWRWALVFLSVWSLHQIVRERFWWSVIMPVLEYKPGAGPVLAETAIFAAGGLLGLVAMRFIERLDNKTQPRP